MKDRPAPSVAVAVATYLREQVMVDTLRQILALDPAPDEVLVVDQTPEHEPGVEAYLRRQDAAGGLRWIRQFPANHSAARNRALAETPCDVVLFLDDDVVMDGGLLERHRRHYRSPEVAAVSGRTHDGRRMERDFRTPFSPRLAELDCGEPPRPTDDMVTANFSVRREVARSLGGFDEHFLGSLYEDSDFARRLRGRGERMLFDPDAWVVHLVSPTGGARLADPRTRPEWEKLVGFSIFAFRHGPCFETLFAGLKNGVLRKENRFKPWRWPWALSSYAYAVLEGWRRARQGVKSPFTSAPSPRDA